MIPGCSLGESPSKTPFKSKFSITNAHTYTHTHTVTHNAQVWAPRMFVWVSPCHLCHARVQLDHICRTAWSTTLTHIRYTKAYSFIHDTVASRRRRVGAGTGTYAKRVCVKWLLRMWERFEIVATRDHAYTDDDQH